ncbi:MAG: GAF domain-containing protein [Myxococcales bacterium]|nr:GAF domain-containing protein [Myxococcales bacterium]
MSERPIKVLRDTPSGLLTGLSEKLTELEEAVGRQADRLHAVLEIGTAISSARDIDQLLRLVMDRLTALLGADASSLFMLDARKKELWSRVVRGSALKEIRLPITTGIAGHVVTTGETLILPDAYADIRFNPDIDRLSGFRTRSIVAAPLKHVSGRILGVVEVLHRKVNAFNNDDRALVEAVASQIAAVLDNVLLLEELRAQNEKLLKAGEELTQAIQDLDLLYEIEKAVSSSEQQTDLLDRILAKATSVIGAGAGSILLLAEDHDELYFKSVRGENSEALISMTLRSGQGIAGHVAATGETIRVEHAEDCPLYDRSIAKKLGVAVDSVLCVPIEGEDRVVGALELLNKPGGFDQAEERLATLLAGQTGRAIHLRSAREEGERKARLATVGQMLSGVLHDLRTPLTIIGGYVQLMAEDDEKEQRRNYAAVVQKQIDHIGGMTRETLAFAKGERELFLRKIYLQNFVKEVEEYLRRDFERTKVELKVQANYTGTARVDENKLKRVVYNIARNAVQAMPEGGRFTFTVDREEEDLVLRFQDNGPGIPPEIADKLFQSFVTAGKRDGTGLGLAIVKKIAEEHGGSVTFKSKPSKGTTFEVRIPAGTPAG